MQRLLPLICILFLFSCQKEVEPNQTDPVSVPGSGCKLVTSRVHDATGLPTADSSLYYYKGDKVYKVTGGDPADSMMLEYAGNNIVKRKHYSSGVLIGYDDFNYYPDGNLKSMVSFWDAGIPGAGMERIDSTVFSYTGSKLSKREYYLIDIMGASAGLILDEENLFTFTGNNLTKEIRRRYNNSGTLNWADTSLIQYDSEPNLLKKQGFPHLQANPMLSDSYGYYLAFFVSENNVISGRDSQNPASLQTFTCVKDSKGNLMQINADGVGMLSYKVACP